MREKLRYRCRDGSASRRGGTLAEHRSHRLAEPADIAAIVAYLLSEDGEWVNGQVWSVDGGHVLRG